jgi:hypothetical protein
MNYLHLVQVNRWVQELHLNLNHLFRLFQNDNCNIPNK